MGKLRPEVTKSPNPRKCWSKNSNPGFLKLNLFSLSLRDIQKMWGEKKHSMALSVWENELKGEVNKSFLADPEEPLIICCFWEPSGRMSCTALSKVISPWSLFSWSSYKDIVLEDPFQEMSHWDPFILFGLQMPLTIGS